MDDCLRTESSTGRFLKRIRWFVLVTGVFFVCMAGYIVIYQTKNQILVVNNSSESIGFEIESLGRDRTHDDQIPEPQAVFATQRVSPKSRSTCAFRVDRRQSFVLVCIRNTEKGEKKSYHRMDGPTWGNRVSLIVDTEPTSNCDVSALRKWFDANQSWLVAYRRWLPVSTGWWD